MNRTHISDEWLGHVKSTTCVLAEISFHMGARKLKSHPVLTKFASNVENGLISPSTLALSSAAI